MSNYYPLLDEYKDNEDNLTLDLTLKKEFYIYGQKKQTAVRSIIDHEISKSKKLILNSYQNFVSNFININTPYTRLLLIHQPGVGKCNGFDTPILMFDGSIKKVQDIKVGEYLMGDDSTSRQILSLARGEDEMYDIIPIKGEKFTVNQEHILCLKVSQTPSIKIRKEKRNNNITEYLQIQWLENNKFLYKRFKINEKEKAKEFFKNINHNEIIEITVKDYIKLDKNVKQKLKLYKVPIDFSEKELPFDPYMIGYWLGDGSSDGSEITTQDSTVLHYFNKNLSKYNLHLSYLNNKSNNSMKYYISGPNGKIRSNIFLNTLKELNLIKNNHIPLIYKCNSKENRLKLLAGLLDSDGHYSKKNNIYKFTQKNEKVMNDVIYLCRSLGFACYKKEKKTSWTYNGIKKYGTTWRISISGEGIEKIPVLCPRKKANSRQQVKDVLVTGFTVKNIGKGKYYGFVIDKNNRYLIGDFTVTHNTISALNIAHEFINYYKKVDEDLGSIFIIGFTKTIFKRELLRPEFGIITKEELSELIKVSQLVSLNNLQKDKDYLKELKGRYNRRILKQNIQFFGYKEFVNKLFILHDSDEHLKLTNLTESEILQYLKEDKIKLNEEILHSFKNSLLICDEIHNVYNSLAPNNWGIAIQIILDFHSQYGNTLRSLFLSATPINNHYTEVVNMINLISDHDKKIHKLELFDKYNKFLPNSLNLIQNASLNKISYIRDINLDFYPSKQFMGTPIKDILYLKFIKCPMSPIHFKTYKNLSIIQQEKNNQEKTNGDVNRIKIDRKNNKYPLTLPLEQIYINDYVLPNPDDKTTGLFKSIDVNTKIRNAPQKWKDDNKIKLIDKKHNSANYELSGNFMLEDNIKIYSTKYYELLKLTKEMIKNKKGKIFIYHNFVNNSGVIFIQEMLKVNGYLDKGSTSTSNTLCTFCAKIRKEHEDKPKSFDHDFKPVRFTMVHSEIQKNIIENNLEIFNLPNNASGDNIKIIIGSKAIKESFDLKTIRNVIILTCPDNISTLIQIIGRSVRKNSHIDLPKNERNVDIYLLVNSIHSDYNSLSDLSYEEAKYQNKVEVYKQIQKIENIFITNSIDSLVNQNIYQTQLNDALFPNKIKNDKLIELDVKKMNLSTFIPFHIQTELNIIKYIIKRLFLEVSNIWDYDTLFSYVLNPPFHVEILTERISEDAFIIALEFLIYKRNNIELDDNLNNNLVNNLFDNNSKIIVDLHGNKQIITYINKYYILTAYNKDELIYIAIDEPFRTNINIPEKKILLNDYLKNSSLLNNYDEIKKFIIEKYQNYNIKGLITFLYDYNIEFHKRLIEEIIEYFYNIYTNTEYKVNDKNHNFYFTLLYYYNKFNLIIFCNRLDIELYNNYYKDLVIKNNDKIESDINEIIISSLEEELIISSFNEDEKAKLEEKKYNSYKYYLDMSNKFLQDKKKKFSKVVDTLLPVGHIIDDHPKLYTIKKKWFHNDIHYAKNIKYIDNDIVIGYNTKDQNSTEIKFKIKPPMSKKVVKDSRIIFTGVVCLTKDKSELVKILHQLSPHLELGKLSKKELCNLIKRELILKELEERKKETNIKYYYLIHE